MNSIGISFTKRKYEDNTVYSGKIEIDHLDLRNGEFESDTSWKMKNERDDLSFH